MIRSSPILCSFPTAEIKDFGVRARQRHVAANRENLRPDIGGRVVEPQVHQIRRARMAAEDHEVDGDLDSGVAEARRRD